MPDDWWKEVRKALVSREKDKVETFKLPKNEENRKLLVQFRVKDGSIKCELAAIEIGGHTIEILCTSVTNAEKLPHDCYLTLYRYRIFSVPPRRISRWLELRNCSKPIQSHGILSG